jgi:uncharacterized protein YjbJ (UPF0337 family)
MSEIADKFKGRGKQAAGDIADDKTLKREGKVDDVASSVKDKVDDAADKVKGMLRRREERQEEREQKP